MEDLCRYVWCAFFSFVVYFLNLLVPWRRCMQKIIRGLRKAKSFFCNNNVCVLSLFSTWFFPSLFHYQTIFFLLPFDRGARVFVMKFFTCDISFPFSLLISYFLFPHFAVIVRSIHIIYLCIIIFVFLLISLFSFLPGNFELKDAPPPTTRHESWMWPFSFLTNEGETWFCFDVVWFPLPWEWCLLCCWYLLCIYVIVVHLSYMSICTRKKVSFLHIVVFASLRNEWSIWSVCLFVLFLFLCILCLLLECNVDPICNRSGATYIRASNLLRMLFLVWKA